MFKVFLGEMDQSLLNKTMGIGQEAKSYCVKQRPEYANI
jgi:hypothetical protein